MAFLLPTLVTAIALSMDALTVSIAAGLSRDRVRWRDAAKVAACFGGFQALMPLLGALLGAAVRPLVERFAPIFAGVVLIALGLYAARGALRGDDDPSETLDFFATRVLFGLGVATSLDAFAVGVSLSLAGAPLAPSVGIIGTTTFVVCLVGVLLAQRVERLLGSRSELFGGVALALLGAKMIVDGFAAR